MSHSCLSVARYLLDRAEEQQRSMSPMKLIKLVYMAHGWMLGAYGRPLFREKVEAWKYGPVIRELYREVREYRGSPVPPSAINPPDDSKEFDESEKDIMNQTYDVYGRYSAIHLSAITHDEGTPWDTVKKIGRSDLIPNDLIEEHYYGLLHGSGN